MIVLTNKNTINVWVNPLQYMKMHSAAATLARNTFYSCFNAPDKLWKALKQHGGEEYLNEIKEIKHFKRVKRYVIREQHGIEMDAYNDFASILPHNACDYLSDPAIADYTCFDVGKNKFISLKVNDRYKEILKHLCDNSQKINFTMIDQTKENLEKTKFQATIVFTEDNPPGWVKTS